MLSMYPKYMYDDYAAELCSVSYNINLPLISLVGFQEAYLLLLH
jgi:hypothetical protein